MGSRLLKRWIHQPIRDRVILKGRQSTIKELIEQNLYDELGGLLRQVGDVGGYWRAWPCAPPARSDSSASGFRPAARIAASAGGQRARGGAATARAGQHLPRAATCWNAP